MQWLLQYTDRNQDALAAEVAALKTLGIVPLYFGLIRPTESGPWEISGLSESDIKGPFMVRGTQRTIQESQSALSWLEPGVYYDAQKFDQAYYQQQGIALFNANARILAASEVETMTWARPVFIRPSEDTKAFDSGIMSPGQTAKQYILTNRHQNDIDYSKVLVSDARTVTEEVRFIIMHGEVIGAAGYRKDNTRIDYSVDELHDSWKAAVSLAHTYLPAELFTMDLARENNGPWEIMEYNCFNCSGLGAMNLSQLFHRIQTRFGG